MLGDYKTFRANTGKIFLAYVEQLLTLELLYSL